MRLTVKIAAEKNQNEPAAILFQAVSLIFFKHTAVPAAEVVLVVFRY